ncbi:MAG: efflux RND transporter periplasmic adaptor subunit [Pseudomonadales bacterium]|nr:efflux RND transporter periplasmic adaptor subunit [Pseudomonadales bacterium]
MMRSYLSAVCLATALLSLTVSAAEIPPTLVVVDAVTELDTAPRTWAPGTVLSQTDAQLGTEVAGLITWVSEVGAHLKQGDTVARINDELLRMAYEDSQSRVRGLEKRLVYLRSEAQRLASLASVNSAAQSQLDQSVANREFAIEELGQARAMQAMHKYRLERAHVSAPFPGQVVERLVDRGEYVGVGQPIARLVDLSVVEVRSQAPLRVAPFVEEGMIIPIRYEDVIREVAVSAVIPVGDLSSRTFEIRLKLDNEQWVIGTSVQIGLPTSSSKRILTVDRDALVLRESGTAVFVVDGNIVRRVLVQTGIGADARIELVASELKIGDNVVVGGAEMLRDGQEVAW